MKQFLYFTIFFASIGTIGLIASNPKLVQQGASYLGIDPASSQESSSNRPEEDHLAKFLSAKNNPPEPSTFSASAIKPETVAIPPPPISHALPIPEQPKVEPPKVMPPQTELPKAELPKIEPATSELPTTETTTFPVVNVIPTVKTPETSKDAGFSSSQHGVASPAAIESLEQWSEPPTMANKSETPLTFIPSPMPSSPETIAHQSTTSPQTTPPHQTDPFLSADSPVPPTIQKVENDPFLQTLNPQTTPAAKAPATVPIMDGVNSVASTSEFSAAPTRSVYDVLPPPSAAPPAQPILQPQPTSPQLPLNASLPALQATSLSVPQAKVGSQLQIDPSVMVEEVPCHGTETVARVGTQVILMCDILPQLRRAGFQVLNENLKRASDEERSQISETEKENFVNMFVENQYPAFLQEQITVALVFNDYLLAKSKEEREMFNKKFGEEFDQHEVPALIKEFGVRDNIELKQYLKDKLGSSLDRERMLWIRSKIAQQWIMFNMQDASGECTHDEMMEFYTNHKDQFTSETQAQWLELFVAFSNHPTEEAARNKIAWMGNQVVAGYPFEEIAKVNSEGFTASKGGFWDWTKKGSLTSLELEQAVFSLQINKMSSIIKGDKGFHIIRVVKREEAETTPFIEAQVTIRERIKMERRQKLQTEYFTELKKRYPTRILREKIDFNLNR
ncbi:MAG: peptidylprolyl isomerase [Planctomycetaceae bacterium]|nr:peptidylprolyl isomerase [Planctomycetaceae bacterium]